MSEKLKIIGVTLVLMFSISLTSFKLSEDPAVTYVYVCGKSKIYHNSKTHSALDRCKSGITKMTESKAISEGKRKCKCRH